MRRLLEQIQSGSRNTCQEMHTLASPKSLALPARPSESNRRGRTNSWGCCFCCSGANLILLSFFELPSCRVYVTSRASYLPVSKVLWLRKRICGTQFAKGKLLPCCVSCQVRLAAFGWRQSRGRVLTGEVRKVLFVFWLVDHGPRGTVRKPLV